MNEPARISEWHDVDAATFREEIVPRYGPAVLRGLVAQWPAVQRARTSMHSIGQYLSAFDKGGAVDAMMMPPHVHGRLFYSDDMRGFNFSRSKASIGEVSDKLLRYAKFEGRPSLVVQSALIADCLPGFAAENRLAILDESVSPRIWLGNAVTTPAHFDESNNVACVVSGTRRFTLFPPEQIANLYIGPIEFTPAGTPIGLFDPDESVFDRFPLAREAMAHAQIVELEPGDALFIPHMWWHHVRSRDDFNLLANYWWNEEAPAQPGLRPVDALVHAYLAFSGLSDHFTARPSCRGLSAMMLVL